MEPDKREAKLPGWARGILCDLRRECEHMRTVAARALATFPGSDTIIPTNGSEKLPDRGLPPGSVVRFRLGNLAADSFEGPWIEARVDRHNPRVVEVRSSGFNGTLRVEPAASNLVYLSEER
jgi:hypothetical protein